MKTQMQLDASSVLPLKKKIRLTVQAGSLIVEKKGDLLDLFLMEKQLFDELSALFDENPQALRKKMIDRFNYAKKITDK
jgi:hypothetical protein